MALLVPSVEHEDTGALAARIEREISEYARHYDRYFEEMCAKKNVTRTKLDPWPRIVLVPRVGILAVGKTKKDAEIAADIYEHTIQVITDAEEVGRYSPVSLGDLFDVEYWSLEQAKIKKEPTLPLGKQVALVTGAASGIGRATTALFMELGAHVVACDRNGHALDAMASEVGGKRRQQLVTCVTDVTKRDQVGRAFTLAARMFGGVDIVVSNAGDAPEGRLDLPEGDEAIRHSLDINLLSHNTVASAAVEMMRLSRRGGCLLFNASKSAFNPGPGFGPYAVAKAALVALMRQYAVDLGRFGIRANAVNADRIRTAIFSGGVLESRAAARGLSVDDYFRSNLLGREVTAHDVAAAFAYLAQAKATTGCVVTVDGGNAAAFPR
jgi:NAD(P)-dependent dehydrogenase (short-subunit alcohol dehydrogenase family)